MNEISNKELSSILQEVNSQEAAELPDDIQEEDAWYYSLENKKAISKDEFMKESKAHALSRKAKLKQQVREIVNEALNNKFIDLAAPLPTSLKKLVIEIETSKYTEQMNKYEAKINQLFKQRISIPKYLKKCIEKCPQAILPMESFVYQASEDFGLGNTFIVSIDVPRIYTPKELVEHINATYPNALMWIDKAITKFYFLKESRDKLEIQMANALMRINTFYDLLKTNVFWYKGLIDKINENATSTEQNN